MDTEVLDDHTDNDHLDDYYHLEYHLEPEVKFRLEYYEMCQNRTDFVWYHPERELSIKCPLPDYPDNPNSYAVPDPSTNTNHCHLECRYLTDYASFDWGPLHSYIENLFREGWIIKIHI